MSDASALFNPGFDTSIPPFPKPSPSKTTSPLHPPPPPPLVPPPPPPLPEALQNLQATQEDFSIKFEDQRKRIISAQMREYDSLMPSLQSLQHLMEITIPKHPDPNPSSPSQLLGFTPNSSPLQGRKLDLILKSPVGPKYKALHDKCGPLLKKLNAMVQEVENSPEENVTVETQQELWRASWNFRMCLSQTACNSEHMVWQSCVKHCTSQNLKLKLNPKVYCKNYREMSKICGGKFTSEVLKASEG
ncbi:hypothetical protein TrLO_g6318 [Triparma laevis f. longispina]|uniref:Uncharacterized protein n=1 Tax=Triparma laevis f. longispina TaxID=1714387 RepID=A0A9W7FTM3_9STRA|nr:hypothetical protein TrLO_g6318 [Triparma laevis f. longispina]